MLQQVAELVGRRRRAGRRDTPLCVRAARARSRRAPRRPRSTSSVAERRDQRARGSSDAATMSRSLTLSARRRAEPASSTRTDGRVRAQPLGDRFAELERLVQQRRAARRALGHAGVERREHRLLELRPEALDAAQRSALGRRAQRVERVDAAAPRTAGARAWARGPAGASSPSSPAGTSRAASRRPGSCRSRAARRASPRASCRCPGSSVTRPSRVSARDRHRARRGSPWPRCGRRRRGG